MLKIKLNDDSVIEITHKVAKQILFNYGYTPSEILWELKEYEFLVRNPINHESIKDYFGSFYCISRPRKYSDRVWNIGGKHVNYQHKLVRNLEYLRSGKNA